ncbi:MAG: AI-2 transport protein TqsA [Planctomycetota bacterium]|jgi:AI-2 transport protein TqsA
MSALNEKNDPQRPASRAGQAIILMSGLVSATILTLALSELQGILRPFFIAVFLCFMVKPLTTKLGRRLGIFGYAFAFAVIFGVFSFAHQVISADTASFRKNYEDTYGPNLKGYQQSLAKSGIIKKVFPSESSETIGERILPGKQIQELLDPKTLTNALGSGASFFFGIFGELIVVLVIMMLLLVESDRLPDRLRRVCGKEKGERILGVCHKIGQSVTRYVSLKVWISLLTSVICVVVMSLFDLHYAITFGIVVFIFNFIPYLGSVIATLFPCLVALLQKDPITAIWLGVSLTAAQQIVGNFVEPKIQGKGLSISPVLIVLSLGFWGWLWGVGGMILAVPITVTIRIILEQFETTRQIALMVGGDE